MAFLSQFLNFRRFRQLSCVCFKVFTQTVQLDRFLENLWQRFAHCRVFFTKILTFLIELALVWKVTQVLRYCATLEKILTYTKQVQSTNSTSFTLKNVTFYENIGPRLRSTNTPVRVVIFRCVKTLPDANGAPCRK